MYNVKVYSNEGREVKEAGFKGLTHIQVRELTLGLQSKEIKYKVINLKQGKESEEKK